VWAPGAETVDLVLGDERRPLVRDPDGTGWWSAPGVLAPGTDYAFSVDSGPPVPDPRSAWQPAGVHGPSRVFDTSAHTWHDQGWTGRDVLGAVVYELHVGTFTPDGTLDAAAEQLEHLVRLGVDVVELLPVAAFNGAHGWGYDGVGLFTVHEPYGGPAALQRFVDAAHGHGIAVCLDVVHNHLGPSGNYLGVVGPYFTDAHQTPWGSAVNLDGPGSGEVRRWVCDSALRWFAEFHVDALRLDAVHALVDDSPVHLLTQLSDEVAALGARLGRPLSLVAETDLNDPVSISPTHRGGWGMTAQWADDVHHAVHALVTGERQGYYVDFGSPEVLRTALTQVFVHAGTYSTFRGRDWGRPVPPGTDGHRFVVFGSDHDQVGNRALGERPSAVLDAGGLAASAALVLLSPFTPMLFMGEEWGARTPWMFFTDHPEPDLAESVRAGRRAEFGGHGWTAADGTHVEVPDPQAPATFTRSRLDWAEPEQPAHARILGWYRTLVALRRTDADLGSGDLAATQVRFEGAGLPAAGATAPWEGWVVVERGAARVVVNLAHDERTVPLRTDEALEIAAAWDPAVLVPPGAGRPDAHVVVPARSVAVLTSTSTVEDD
jgi:maltooligosyltrehalose trehalohydrolase